MRLPVESEPEAFRLVYGLAFVIGVSVLLGYLVDPLAGIALFTAVAVGAFAWDLASQGDPSRRRFPLREAERAGHATGQGRHRALVVANEALTGDAVWDELLRRREPAPVIEVLAPVLQSRTHFVTTDIDRETEDARRRLRETLDSAHRHGLEATGEVGDPIDPLAGITDELRRYDVDEVIVATHRPERANWLEDDMLGRLREQLDVPLTRVVIDRDSGRVEVEGPSVR